MSINDPFSALGGERTIIKPRLGKPVAAGVASLDDILGSTNPLGHDAVQPKAEVPFELLLQQLTNSPAASRNILVAISSPILQMCCRVSNMPGPLSVKNLSSCFLKAINKLDMALEQQQRSQTERVSARYVLCSFIDEKAANTPWGGSGQWAPHSLLLQFFSETWGGEKVFALIQKVMQNPVENRDLLELMSLVLSLGFKGKFKIQDGGEQSWMQLRLQLFKSLDKPQSITALHPEFWKSKAPKPRKALFQVPLWLPVSCMSLLSCALFLGLYFNINTQSDAAFEHIASISFPAPQFPVTNTVDAMPSVGLELPRQLQTEIVEGLVTLKQMGNKSTVILVGDGLFASGSAELTSSAAKLVDKVARELALHPGQITVTGYTDNQPIRSIQFPSNWQLSAKRAEHVGDRIAQLLPNTAIATEGAGAANPIAPNSTPQGRALNRRVEITLLHSQ